MITDFSALESPGLSLLTVSGAIASLPDLVRLLRVGCTAGDRSPVPMR